jgi:predicted GH43/DUF377 family glycosyl hydrolase
MYNFPCIHRGEEVGSFDCGCGIGPQPIFKCNHPALGGKNCAIRLGSTKYRPGGKDLMSCSSCDFSEKPPPPVRPKPIPKAMPPVVSKPRPGDSHRAGQLAEIRAARAVAPEIESHPISTHSKLIKTFDEGNLAVGMPGKRFNASILPYQCGHLMAFRDGWAGSQIHLILLNQDFEPDSKSWRLNLFHGIEANYGREDPRLFMHEGKVHVAYTGVSGGASIAHTSVMYASLKDDLTVDQVFYPHLPTRTPWEKNWSFFSSNGLWAIYSISPHRILKIDGHRADHAFESPSPVVWKGGEMRGGASPVLIDGEWWHFFHDRVSVKGMRAYRTGVYTFDDKPPFKMKRFLPHPILSADMTTRPDGQYAAVTFVCGAVLNGDDWVISSGAHDRWTELHKFSRAELENKMRPVQHD